MNIHVYLRAQRRSLRQLPQPITASGRKHARRLIARRIRIAGGVAVLLLPVLTANAGTFSTYPEAGSWEQSLAITANGQDMLAVAKARQAQALASMSGEQRAKMEALMRQHDPSHDTVCLTAADVAKAQNPQQLLDSMVKKNGACKLAPTTISSNEIQFAGHCSSADGSNSDIQGSLAMQDSRHSHFEMTTRGSASANNAALLHLNPGQPYTTVIKGNMNWLSSKCEAATAAPH